MDLEQVSDTAEELWNGPGSQIVEALLLLLQVLAVIAVGAIVARFAKRRMTTSLSGTALDPNLVVLFANFTVVGIYALAISIVLALFGANWSGFLAVIGAGTIAIGLSLQDVLRSYVAGVYLLLERPFAVGDRIRVKDVDGVVEGVELRTTILRTADGEQVTVPNATIFLEVVTNRSASPARQTTVTVSKVELPLPEIRPAVTAALSGLNGMADKPPRIELQKATAEGTTVAVTVFHPPNADVGAELLAQLRERFPDADLAVENG
jgi:small-conductance mechanosensitive channel